MPLLTTQDIRGSVPVLLTEITLDGTDTFVVESSVTQYLHLKNDTAGAIPVTIVGDEAPATHICTGFGEITTSDISVNVDVGKTQIIPVSNLQSVLAGTATITGGTGLTASLVTT